MQKRHYDLLVTRLENILLQGFGTITYDELKYWFDSHKLGKNVWKEILDMWDEMPEIKGRDSGKDIPKGKLKVKYLYGQYIYLFFSDNGTHFISEWAELKEHS